jgi:hypothetical protein
MEPLRKIRHAVRVLRRTPGVFLALVVASLVIAAGCDDGRDGSSMKKRDTSSTAARSVIDGVLLATPARGFRQCEDAAETLGLAVPCPTRLPLIKGKRVDCSGPCLVMAGGGETLDRIFFLNVDGYDAAPSSPPVHHMIIEARKVGPRAAQSLRRRGSGRNGRSQGKGSDPARLPAEDPRS